MTKSQFRVLYREFLFRMVDLELLSAHAQGDVSRLLGQFASLFVFVSLLFAGRGAAFGGAHLPLPVLTLFAWGSEQSLIATTMLAVGLLAVVSWDSTFPDRRDVMVLSPLPIRASTLFLAKIAALATALLFTVGILHVLSNLTWPVALGIQSAAHDGRFGAHGFAGWLRVIAAYWISMLGAGAFIFCSVLTIQGFVAMLPRKIFLRLSGFLQMAAFVLFVCVYFLEPGVGVILARHGQGANWQPVVWFLGLFQVLSGSPPTVFTPFAGRACIGLAIALTGAGSAFLLSYFHTLRKIVEQPDILPGAAGLRWLPRFGSPFHTAVVQFSIRTLSRSRLHRVMLAFYLGVGFALTIFFLQVDTTREELLKSNPWHTVSVPLIACGIVMMGFWIVGTRVVFSMPLDLRANWVFRTAPVKAGKPCVEARRRAMLVLSLAPVWLGSGIFYLCIWPWRSTLAHLVILALLGSVLIDLSLGGIQKIPFTCSYLPGKSNFHLTFWLCIGLIFGIVVQFAVFEKDALQAPHRFAGAVAMLAVVLVVTRWWSTPASWETSPVEFEEVPSSSVIQLGLSSNL
jgi:hypothetical protein